MCGFLTFGFFYSIFLNPIRFGWVNISFCMESTLSFSRRKINKKFLINLLKSIKK